MPMVLLRPVTFVTGNAKKLEEVRSILGQSIPFQSLKLDRNHPFIPSLVSSSVSNFDSEKVPVLILGPSLKIRNYFLVYVALSARDLHRLDALNVKYHRKKN